MVLMSIFKKIIIFIFLITHCSLLFTSPVLAADEFETSYHITYTVNTDASVAVSQNISLKNKLANIYASQYQITLGSTRVRGVWANHGSKTLTPQVEKKQNTTTIRVEFEDKVVGKGKSLDFSLGYISDDYAMKNGRVLEIGIPKLAEADKLSEYQVSLFVPYIFEKPAYMFPQPDKTSPSAKATLYTFSKNKLSNQSITAAFANFQVFDFNLKYFLKNSLSSPALFEISLPPDSAYQKIYLETLNPQPLNIKIDEDSNWLASYKLEPEEKLEILATGSAEIFINPRINYVYPAKIKPEKYLAWQKFWPVDNQEIKDLSRQLKTPKAIYDYVVSNLLYDYDRVNQKPQRMGAVEALNNKTSAVCMEFTDLFITLARAAGIPAREVNGFAYTNNPQLRPLSLKQDVLHAWPQYYDEEKQLWLNIDPTWGNTTGGIDFFNKLDLNHFAFVYHGLDSELPLAAGSYKNEETESKDVDIKFGSQPLEKTNLTLELKFPKKAVAGLPVKGTVKVKNKGNVGLYNTIGVLDLSDLGLNKKEIKIAALLPFAFLEKQIILPKTSISLKGEKEIGFTVLNQKASQSIQVYSFLPAKVPGLIKTVYSWLLAILEKLIKIIS